MIFSGRAGDLKTFFGVVKNNTDSGYLCTKNGDVVLYGLDWPMVCLATASAKFDARGYEKRIPVDIKGVYDVIEKYDDDEEVTIAATYRRALVGDVCVNAPSKVTSPLRYDASKYLLRVRFDIDAIEFATVVSDLYEDTLDMVITANRSEVWALSDTEMRRLLGRCEFDGFAEGIYSLPYLSDIVRPLTGSLVIEFDQDAPMKITFRDGIVEGLYFLAPRKRYDD